MGSQCDAYARYEQGLATEAFGRAGAWFHHEICRCKTFRELGKSGSQQQDIQWGVVIEQNSKKEKPGGNHLSASCKYTQGGKMPAWRLLRHMRAKRGNRQAMVTTGKKLASIFYIMVQRKIEYDEQMYNNHRKEELQNKVIYLQKQLQRMELELANCR